MKKLAIILGTLVLLLLTGCSHATTAPDQIALHYTGGSYSAQKYQDCVAPSTRERFGPSDKYAYYPTGQRSYSFADAPNSDAGPLTATTKDQQEIVVRGVVTFTLDTSCEPYTDKQGKTWPGGKIQKFHELIGRKFEAAATDKDQRLPDGWATMLRTYILTTIDRAVDNEALKYGWRGLYSSAETKAQWEKDVLTAIPGYVLAQAGESFFTVDHVLIQKPDISATLKAQLAAEQAAILRGNAANIDKATAETWPGGVRAYLEYQRQLSVNKAIESGQVKVIPIPDGAGINVTLPDPTK